MPTAPHSPPSDPEDRILSSERYNLDFDMSVFVFEDDDVPAEPTTEQPSAKTPPEVPLDPPTPADSLQELSSLLKRPVAKIVEEERL